MYTRFGLVAKDIPDEMPTVSAAAAAVAATILHEFLNLLIARQLCWRLPPKELLKELEPLKDPLRPLVD